MANEQERDDSMTAESWGRMEKAIIVMGHELEIPREIVLPILKKLYQVSFMAVTPDSSDEILWTL